MYIDKNFLGRNGFIWFNGVVEDRQDPQYLGRLRVRCIGFHTQDKAKLPTADLPWASVILPTTSAGISGLGSSPSFMVEGTWVMGYFRDGDNCQEPVILGTLPGRPAELGKSNIGFNDPNFRLDENGEPTTISVYPRKMNEVDTNRLAVNLKEEKVEILPHATLTQRRTDRILGIATADFNSTTAADGSIINPSDGDIWNQPEIPYNAVYPYNHVVETESGHIKELDDSFIIDEEGIRTNHYRIHERHTSGTSYEIGPNGTRTDILKGDHYTLLTKDNKVSIGGNSDITIDGRHRIYINKSNTPNNDYTIQVGTGANVNIQVDSGDVNIVTVQGKMNLNSGGDFNVKVGGTMTFDVEGNMITNVNGTNTENTSGAKTIRGSTIDLNP
jgi:hypothetical protein